MAATLDHFSDRLKAGAKADLLSLARLPFVKSRTALVTSILVSYRSIMAN